MNTIILNLNEKLASNSSPFEYFIINTNSYFRRISKKNTRFDPDMKEITLAGVLLAFTLTLSAQNPIFGFHYGLGSYKMKDLKAFNQTYTGQLPFEVKQTDNFPPWLYFRFNVGINWDRIETGLSYSSRSTGARYTVEDYSGKYTLDNRIHAEGPGFWLNYVINPGKRLRFLISSELGLYFSKLNMDEYLHLSDQSIIDESFRFISRNIYWEPGFKSHFDMDPLVIEAYLGYCLQSGKNGLVYLGSMGEGDLTHYGSPVAPGWGGIRVSMGIQVNLSKWVKPKS